MTTFLFWAALGLDALLIVALLYILRHITKP
jgi:hypothetical protein